ncbi:hypothetical protein [Moraxella lacunata]
MEWLSISRNDKIINIFNLGEIYHEKTFFGYCGGFAIIFNSVF